MKNFIESHKQDLYKTLAELFLLSNTLLYCTSRSVEPCCRFYCACSPLPERQHHF